MTMGRKIGEVFTIKGKLYSVEYGRKCCDCAFVGTRCKDNLDIAGQCISEKRTDGMPVIFKEVKTKEE